MNRRDVLKGLGAALAGVVVPKPLQKDVRVEELEQESAAAGIQSQSWKVACRFWMKEARIARQAETWWKTLHDQVAKMRDFWYEHLQETLSVTSDLAVEVAYWKEQYEQSLECCDRWREKAMQWRQRYDELCLVPRVQEPTLEQPNYSEWEGGMGWAAIDDLPESDCSFGIRVQHGKCEGVELSDSFDAAYTQAEELWTKDGGWELTPEGKIGRKIWPKTVSIDDGVIAGQVFKIVDGKRFYREHYDTEWLTEAEWREHLGKQLPSFIDRRFTQQENGRTIWFVDSTRPDDTGDGLSLATAKKTEAGVYKAICKGTIAEFLDA